MKRAALVASLFVCSLPCTAYADSSSAGAPSPEGTPSSPAVGTPSPVAPPEGVPASSDAPATSPPAAALAEPAGPAAPPRPAPYSLPWQLRPAMAVSVVRSDTAVAFYEDARSNHGTTIASTLLASYKVTPEIAPLVRLGLVHNSPPDGASALSLVNPIFGCTYGMKLSPELRLALFLAVTAPIGQGGGNSPDASQAAATRSGIWARSALDNAMFAVNDFTVIPGAGLAWVQSGLTVQIEATVLQLTRVRGADVQPDSSKTNFTGGVHVGYFIVPELSVGAELRHQRWLSTPAAVEKDASLRDTTTFAIGPRAHLKLSGSVWFRPGIAYARGIDKPMTTSNYNIVQLDFPFVF